MCELNTQFHCDDKKMDSPENMYMAARKDKRSRGLGTVGGGGEEGQGGRGGVEGEASKGEERKRRREGIPANRERLFQVI